MSRDALVAQARRTLAHARAGTAPVEDEVYRVPTRNYTDPERWRLEVERVFRRLPLVIALSCELAEPNSYRSVEVLGVPVLLARGGDGVLRSFVNTCSHRGSIVVPVGSGTARRFTCPYHAWAYDAEGTLVGIFQRERFGDVDTSCLGLTPLPVAERAGLVFGGVVPGMDFDVDRALCGYDELLEHHRLAECRLVGRYELPGCNWKLAYDGYLDFYHLPILHRRTFGGDYSNLMCTDAWGPHQRQMQPDQRILALGELPEDEWPLDTLLAGVWTVFPHVSIASFRVRDKKLYQIAQLFPGTAPDTSTTVMSYLASFDPTDEDLSDIEKQMDFLRDVVENEDYFTTGGIQRGLRVGTREQFLFGRNEGNGQRFHQWLDRLVAAETPADTAALLGAAEEFHHP